ELEYSELSAIISEGELPKRACSLVIKAMCVYDALQRSYAALDRPTTVSESEVRFPGFDGNNETRHMAYAEFVRSAGRFTYLRVGSDGLNSHMPMTGQYRSMAVAWQ